MFNNFLKIINFKVFLVSLLVGLIYIYFENDKTKIYVYPTPSNIEEVLYKDTADNCFKYNMKEIPCPKNKQDINNIPVQ